MVNFKLNGKEVSVGVMNYKNEIKVFGITEIVTTNDFFDYEAKYEGKSNEITPARIDEKIYSNKNFSVICTISFCTFQLFSKLNMKIIYKIR